MAERGIRQKDVTQRFEATTMTVAYWKINRNQPSLRMILRITVFLGYNPNYGIRAGETLGDRIVRVRCALGIRQKDLARQLKVDPTTLAKWERDHSRPIPRNRERIEAFIASAIEVEWSRRDLGKRSRDLGYNAARQLQ